MRAPRPMASVIMSVGYLSQANANQDRLEGEGGDFDFLVAEVEERGVDADAECYISMTKPGEETGGENPATGREPAEASDQCEDMVGLCDDGSGAEHVVVEVHWRSAHSSRRWRWPEWR